MKAAIYARKSNDDNDRNVENKSITRQVERARAYAESKGWVVNDEHVFSDDGISGAEYLDRPGLLRLQSCLKEFDVLVCSEISRIGRDMVRNAVVIDEIISANVRIFYYLSDNEELFDTPEQRLMVTLSSFSAEMERAKTAERTRDALERKAMQGHSAGGRCYGFDLIPIYGTSADGERVKSHTDFKINEEQAEIIRGVFRMYVDGFGHTAVAKAMNGEPRYAKQNLKYFNGATPKPPQTGTGSWGPSGIRAMLYRPRYAGTIEYGRTKKIRAGGSAKKRGKGDKVVTVEREDLRIIDKELWGKVQKRLAKVKENYLRENNGTLWGRPDTGRESKYLLTGIARCGCCGANIVVMGGQKHKHYYYGCSHRIKRGSTVCENSERIIMPSLDSAVLETIEQSILTPAAFDYVVDKALQIVKERQNQKPSRVPKIEKEIGRLRRELDNFMALIASGNAMESVLGEIGKREERIKFLEAELTRYVEPPQLDELKLPRMRKQAEEKLGQFQKLLHSNVPRARQALRKLLRDEKGDFAPIVVRPVGRGAYKTFEFEGQTTLGRLLYNAGAEERT